MPMRPRLFEEDVLSDVLGLMRIRGEVMCRSTFTAPFGLAFGKGSCHFHLVEDGTCFIAAPRVKARLLVPGDLVVLPHGEGHRLSDAHDRRAVPFKSLVGEHYERASILTGYGGGGAAVRMVCGVFRFGNPAAATMLAALPTLLHVPSAERDAGTLLSSAIPILLQETASRAPGSALTTAHLINILLVYAVRYWLTSAPAGSGGWTAALRDPKISWALAQLHAAPARSWTVAALAATVGMSRSPFAARFTAAVREPPLRYLTRWRMHLAADLLLNEEWVSVREVAARVGYEAEEAFSRAFKRFFHASPAAFRKRSNSSL